MIAAGVLALNWWIIALRGLHALLQSAPDTSQEKRPGISCFKAFPTYRSEAETAIWKQSVDSLLSHLGTGDEIIIGIHSQDRERFQAWLDPLKRQSHCQMRIIYESPPGLHANHKIDWMQILAAEANKPLWFWSDVDIVMPENFSDSLTQDAVRLVACGMITYAYRMDTVGSIWGLLDASFVNTTMLPGLAMMQKKPDLGFGLGAGMLFRAEDFRERASWMDLGRQLTDDNYLGRHLSPVQLGTAVLSTSIGEVGVLEAIVHYYRWEKTIRWVEPMGYFLQILVQPLAIAIVCLFLLPALWGILLITSVLLAESAYLAIAHRKCGMPVSMRFLAMPLIPVCRLFIWLSTWLPFGVWWRGQYWNEPTQNTEAKA